MFLELVVLIQTIQFEQIAACVKARRTPLESNPAYSAPVLRVPIIFASR